MLVAGRHNDGELWSGGDRIPALLRRPSDGCKCVLDRRLSGVGHAMRLTGRNNESTQLKQSVQTKTTRPTVFCPALAHRTGCLGTLLRPLQPTRQWPVSDLILREGKLGKTIGALVVKYLEYRLCCQMTLSRMTGAPPAFTVCSHEVADTCDQYHRSANFLAIRALSKT